MPHLSETELDDCQLIARNEASIFTAQRVIQYDVVMRCAIKKGLTLEHVPAMVEALTTLGTLCWAPSPSHLPVVVISNLNPPRMNLDQSMLRICLQLGA